MSDRLAAYMTAGAIMQAVVVELDHTPRCHAHMAIGALAVKVIDRLGVGMTADAVREAGVVEGHRLPVFRLMARGAVAGVVRLRRILQVTFRAGSNEGMIKRGDILPVRYIGVAGFARAAEVIRRLIGCVALRTLHDTRMLKGGHNSPVLRVDVAALAITLVVIGGRVRRMARCAFRDANMVEPERRPVSDEMAVGAIAGIVLQRRCVTGRALVWRAFVDARGMTRFACSLVPTFQWEEAVVNVLP